MKLPDVYILLGARGSGRHDVLFDLVCGYATEDKPACVLAEASACAMARTHALGSLDCVELVPYRVHENRLICELQDSFPSVIFILYDGTSDVIDHLEAYEHWLRAQNWEVTRILTVVHCALLSQIPQLEPWFHACIHFSDCVLLNHRHGVSNKWIQEFQERYYKLCFPCVFELVKQGRVDNPAQVLSSEVRRWSHAFDAERDAYDFEGAEHEDDVAQFSEPSVDPYFARKPDGRRSKIIPNISDCVEGI